MMNAKIKEKMKQGMSTRKATAMAIAEAFKEKKMAMGGMVEDEMSDEMEQEIPIYPEGEDNGLSESTEMGSKLAQGLLNSKMKANDNTVSYQAEHPMKGAEMDEPGLLDEKDSLHSSVGSKPSMKMQAVTSEPMADMKNPANIAVDPEEAMKAIMERKKKRKYDYTMKG